MTPTENEIYEEVLNQLSKNMPSSSNEEGLAKGFDDVDWEMWSLEIKDVCKIIKEAIYKSFLAGQGSREVKAEGFEEWFAKQPISKYPDYFTTLGVEGKDIDVIIMDGYKAGQQTQLQKDIGVLEAISKDYQKQIDEEKALGQYQSYIAILKYADYRNIINTAISALKESEGK